jgi:di/tricarboxylate transporter
VFKEADPWVMTLLVCLLVAGVTEITSNTAIASLMMPIVFELVSFFFYPLEVY